MSIHLNRHRLCRSSTGLRYALVGVLEVALEWGGLGKLSSNFSLPVKLFKEAKGRNCKQLVQKTSLSANLRL